MAGLGNGFYQNWRNKNVKTFEHGNFDSSYNRTPMPYLGQEKWGNGQGNSRPAEVGHKETKRPPLDMDSYIIGRQLREWTDKIQGKSRYRSFRR